MIEIMIFSVTSFAPLMGTAFWYLNSSFYTYADLLHYVEDGFAFATEFGHDESSVLEVAGGIGATFRAVGRAGFGFGFIQSLSLHRFSLEKRQPLILFHP